MKRALPTALLLLASLPAQTPPEQLTFDRARAVQQRRILPAAPATAIDWEQRIDALLREQPGDVVVTAVGDLIFNEQISTLADPDRRQLLRLMQEADIAYGNLEFSLNSHPELQRPFYNFRADPAFVWELAATGINLVSMANNHALDFGPEGLTECLRTLSHANIASAGAGTTLAEAHAPAVKKVQSQKTRFCLLAYMRYWTARYRSSNANAPSLATIDPAQILVAGADGKVTAVEGPLQKDVETMEDDVVLARRHQDVVLVALHNHDTSHHRAFGVQDTTPPNDAILYRRAVEAGADVVLGSGPHVLRGIEIHRGKPILYSLGDFVYQYRTPGRIPVDLIHQRDGEIERPTNVSVWDRRDPEVAFQSVLARMTWNGGVLKRLELVPVTIDREGPRFGAPRLPDDQEGRAILQRVQQLSAPYGTKFTDRGWYVEVVLPQ